MDVVLCDQCPAKVFFEYLEIMSHLDQPSIKLETSLEIIENCPLHRVSKGEKMDKNIVVRISIEVPEGMDPGSTLKDQVLVFEDVETANCAAQAAFDAAAELESDDV